MPFRAGQRITAARLLNDMDSVVLSSVSTISAVAPSWEDYGTESITFPNPGINVNVMATVSFHVFNAGTTDRAGGRVAISLDGGSSFTTGNEPLEQVGGSIGNTGAITAKHNRSGTPTGDIVIKAQVSKDGSTGIGAFRGELSAEIQAQ